MANYEFRYAPLTGRLTGTQMIEQTEQAINGLASLVDEAAGQVNIISSLANEANENAATALEKAEEALATTGRTYITVSIQADANDYYDSQLIYIADSTSTNIPVEDAGFLEVKTNDDKTACEQVFIADTTGNAYNRNGSITAETVGGITTYSVTWGGWSSQPASQAYVQGELANYLPLSGGTVTGGLTVEETITGNLTGNVTGNADTATNATNDGNGNEISATYLPLAGGTMTGSIGYTDGNKAFDIGFSDANKDNIDIGWNYADGTGAGIGLRSVDHTDAGAFDIYAKNGNTVSTLNGTPGGVLTWGSNQILTIIALGNAPNNTTKSFTLPASGTYLLLTGHNSSPGMCGIWMIRTGGNSAFKLAGGGDVTVTCSGTTITVKPTAGAANVWAVAFPAT